MTRGGGRAPGSGSEAGGSGGGDPDGGLNGPNASTPEAVLGSSASSSRSLSSSPALCHRPRATTDADLPIAPLYDSLSPVAAFAPLRPLYGEASDPLGRPGEPPYTRGIHATMYRERLWTMRQYAGFGTAAESNRRYRYLIEQGQTGLSVAFDLPTQMGLDSDHARAVGEVGRVGVAIDSLEDMRVLLDGLPLERVTTSMTINATAAILLALYVVAAEERGAPRGKLGGTIQNDILKEYIARGTYIYPPSPSMRLVVDTFRFCAAELPRWNSISISGYHIREAGADAAQELAFTLANGVAYVEAAVGAGLAVDTFAPRLAFFFNVHNNLLEEVAKFRAARRLWSWLMRERFGARDPRSWLLRFHAQTAGSTLTAQQPLNNVARTTLQALAAVLGGCQSLHTNGYDEALSLPTEASARLALRTQQVLAHESGVADFVDPLGGSYVVETLTNQLEQRGRDHLRRIDELGGAVAAIERGYQKREIEQRAYEHQRALEQHHRLQVGVNCFEDSASDGGAAESTAQSIAKGAGWSGGTGGDEDFSGRARAQGEQHQRARLRELRTRRDGARVARALAAVAEVARGSGNLMEPLLEAVRAEATVGELAGALRDVFGEHHEAI
jgi:methylmalonyl-CoA mutase N-terminal domain/subunit